MNRLKNNFKNNFVTGDAVFFRENKISLQAIGLYFYLAAKPQEWDFSVARMAQQLTNGEKAIQSAAKELVAAGVLLRQPKREGKKFTGWSWILHPAPEDLQSGKDPVNRSSHGTPPKGVDHEGTDHDGGDKIKRQEQKNKSKNANNNPPLPPTLDRDVWGEWLKYLAGRNRNKTTQTTLIKQAQLLAQYPPAVQKAMVDDAICANYGRPYPPKPHASTAGAGWTNAQNSAAQQRQAFKKQLQERLNAKLY